MTRRARPYNENRRSFHRWECKTCGRSLGMDNIPQEAIGMFLAAHVYEGHEVIVTHSTVGAERPPTVSE